MWSEYGELRIFCRKVPFGPKPQTDQRQRVKFASGVQFLVLLKALESINRGWAPFACGRPFKISPID